MSEKKFIKFLLVMVAIGLLFVAYGRYVERVTIENANLIEVDNNGYSIEFNGQIHEYNF